MEVPVVSFIVNRLGVLLTEEAKFLYGVSDQVEQIRVELKRMQCFLQDADYAIQSDHHVDAGVNNWVAEIRKLAYETEDILETFLIQVSSKRNKKGF
ncbi:putative disease resistance protein [Camellia lanceoleosa]|uniref:Disease resistance protein n=1 Tax=Camellia lanceoleosa TaxID=1840588 RepID=A0ACC0F8C8_9ERIC|nr:putative disease resistance protein [Camellia lanceoleosa]